MLSKPLSKLGVILTGLLVLSGATCLLGVEGALDRRLQANATPKISFTVSSGGLPNITMTNFQAVPRVPDTPVSVSNLPSSLNGSVFNIPLTLGTNAGRGINTGQLVLPWNAQEIQLGFDDTCLLPIAVLTPNSTLFTSQLTSDATGTSRNLLILSGQVVGPLGVANATTTSVDYSNQATSDARAKNLTTLGLKFPGGVLGNSSALFVYCPLRAQESVPVNFVANVSSTNLTANTTATTTSDPNNVALIIGLTIGLGFPVLMFFLLFVWWFFFRRGKKFKREPLKRTSLPLNSGRQLEAVSLPDKHRATETQPVTTTLGNGFNDNDAGEMKGLHEIKEDKFGEDEPAYMYRDPQN